MFFKASLSGINELKLILIWSSLPLIYSWPLFTLSEHTKRTDFNYAMILPCYLSTGAQLRHNDFRIFADRSSRNNSENGKTEKRRK